jgi:hypothetical protein
MGNGHIETRWLELAKCMAASSPVAAPDPVPLPLENGNDFELKADASGSSDASSSHVRRKATSAPDPPGIFSACISILSGSYGDFHKDKLLHELGSDVLRARVTDEMNQLGVMSTLMMSIEVAQALFFPEFEAWVLFNDGSGGEDADQMPSPVNRPWYMYSYMILLGASIVNSSTTMALAIINNSMLNLLSGCDVATYTKLARTWISIPTTFFISGWIFWCMSFVSFFTLIFGNSWIAPMLSFLVVAGVILLVVWARLVQMLYKAGQVSEKHEEGSIMSAVEIHAALLKYKEGEQSQLFIDWDSFLTFLRREYGTTNPLPSATRRIAEMLFEKEIGNIVAEEVAKVEFKNDELLPEGVSREDIFTRAKFIREKRKQAERKIRAEKEEEDRKIRAKKGLRSVHNWA